MKIAINHNSPVPLYLQVENLLREMITKEEYQNGKILPGENELSKKLGISRNTFRMAINKLVYEGLLVRKKGIGTSVNTNVITTGLKAWSSFSHEMISKGINLTTIKKKIVWETPTEEVASAFNINDDKKILRLERLKGTNGTPIVLFNSYFHPRIGLKENEKFEGPLYEILENNYHIIPTQSDEEIGAFLPDAYLRRMLDIKVKNPVLYRKRIVCDAAGKPIEFAYCYYRSDKFIYKINIKREDF